MTKHKVLMMATTAAMIEQFNKNNIRILVKNGYEVHMAGNFCEGNPISDDRLIQFRKWMDEQGCKCFHIPATRKPTDLNNYRAYKEIVKMIRENRYAFIHCHTPIGSVIGRVAAHVTNTPIIYTAHGFHFYDGAPLKNWLLFYPIEKFLSRWTDLLILINKEDYSRAKKSFYAKEVKYIPGIGINLKRFDFTLADANVKKELLGIPDNAIIILSVGELNKNKNHEVIIRAISQLRKKNVHYVVAGRGELQFYLNNLSETLNVDKQIHILGFRDDVSELYKIADMFAFPSYREGLSVSLMEAMASGLPCIVSKARGNTDLIDENGGILCHANSSAEFAHAIEEMINNRCRMNSASCYNRKKIEQFDEVIVNKQMVEIYRNFGSLNN